MKNKINVKLLNEHFGTDLRKRVYKLSEELFELQEVLENEDSMTPEQFKENFIDELADMNIILFHIANIVGVNQNDLIGNAFDKIRGRLKDPNYRRTHEHQERTLDLNPCCANCQNADQIRRNGIVVCDQDKKQYDCASLACEKWKVKESAEMSENEKLFRRALTYVNLLYMSADIARLFGASACDELWKMRKSFAMEDKKKVTEAFNFAKRAKTEFSKVSRKIDTVSSADEILDDSAFLASCIMKAVDCVEGCEEAKEKYLRHLDLFPSKMNMKRFL